MSGLGHRIGTVLLAVPAYEDYIVIACSSRHSIYTTHFGMNLYDTECKKNRSVWYCMGELIEFLVIRGQCLARVEVDSAQM
jgi:hypothetical protein